VYGELYCAADVSRNVRPQRRVEPVINDPTVVPDLPVQWTGNLGTLDHVIFYFSAMQMNTLTH